jgi:crotonobetainyl-CoA:carnitine CoA-transferase CaiB-like acyl-CoA transferase
VVEFTHMVMGPTCGMVLADMGAEVIKVEPIEGDRTRHLLGAGAGFFPMFNRNKKSIAIDLHHPKAPPWRAGWRPAPTWWPRTSSPAPWEVRAGLRRALAAVNPRLIYVSHKGFLPGPYEHRTALDEVVQMMGGLAYMTGRPGDPLRAGTSVNDIMGGMFGAIGTLGALMQRGITGRGRRCSRAVREQRVPGRPAHAAVRHHRPAAAPMPERISAPGRCTTCSP